MELVAVEPVLRLPFYHLGLRATQQLTDRLALTVAAYNGWNDVDDDNEGKSVSSQFAYTKGDDLLFSVLYFGGPKRPAGAPEGQPWRHLLDGWVEVKLAPKLSVAANADAGFEDGRFGVSWWAAAALYAGVHALKWLYVAARGDAFREHAASSALGAAARVFWPGDWVAEGTATLDAQPVDGVS
ncbi:MAG TPA: outer membrane beta-barrel protein, partial [Minicystis sp.]|nr:outer membrane beta-barrel protein [Minicystis sp.]